ncbi:hypothetical protein AB5V95_00060 [Metamycoplasma spumans]|uniref:hypothetical protein n=1 Tax=Metamycoplasma spumans TaxID=92406 RepID=UPI0034DCDC49
MKNIEKVNNTQKRAREVDIYSSKSTRILWFFAGIIAIFMLAISYLDIAYLTTIHSYSINVLFGMFSPFLYIFVLLISIWKVFKLRNTFSVKVFHLNLYRISFLFISFAVLGTMIFYTQKLSYGPSNVFSVVYKDWFNSFKNTKNNLLPNIYTAGVVNAFIFSILTFAGNRIGIAIGFLVAIILIVISISFLFIDNDYFNLISFSKKKRQQAIKSLREKRAKNTTNNKNINNNSNNKININDNHDNQVALISEETKQIENNNDQKVQDNNANLNQEIIDQNVDDFADLSDFEIEEDKLENNIELSEEDHQEIYAQTFLKQDNEVSELKNTEEVVIKNETEENNINKKDYDYDNRNIEENDDEIIDIIKVDEENTHIDDSVLENSNIENDLKEEKTNEQRYSIIKDEEDMF